MSILPPNTPRGVFKNKKIFELISKNLLYLIKLTSMFDGQFTVFKVSLYAKNINFRQNRGTSNPLVTLVGCGQRVKLLHSKLYLIKLINSIL